MEGRQLSSLSMQRMERSKLINNKCRLANKSRHRMQKELAGSVSVMFINLICDIAMAALFKLISDQNRTAYDIRISGN